MAEERYTIHQAQQFIQRLYKGRYVLISGYNGSLSKCKWFCRKHQSEYHYIFQHAATRKSCGCIECRREIGEPKQGKFLKTKHSQFVDYSNDRLADSFQKQIIWFDVKAEEKFGDKFRYIKYRKGERGKLYVLIQCPDHGVFEMLGAQHLRSVTGCEQCGRHEMAKKALGSKAVDDGHKQCSCCKQVKPVSQFRRAGKLKSGETAFGLCSKCYREKDRQYRKSLGEKHTDYQRIAATQRRMRKINAFVEKVDASRVYKRDKYRCYICGVKVVPGAPSTQLNAATLDHIIPFKHGGKESYSNVRTCCRSCNSKKGAKLIGQLIMSI